MDYQQTRTPGWMVGLLTIFALATATAFGWYLYCHALKAAYHEEYVNLKADIKNQRASALELAGQIPLADAQIQARHALISSLDASEKQTESDVNRLTDTNRGHVKSIKDSIEKLVITYVGLLKDAKQNRLEVANNELTAMNQEREFDEKRLALREKIEKLSQSIEDVKKKTRKANAEFDARIAELQDRVRQLTQQRELDTKALRSAGQILQSQASDGFVILNRGQRNHLRKGTRFAVYNLRGGKNVIKGTIEVMRVEDQISVARVLKENDGNDPIIVNDHIANPVYDPDKIRGFAIRGDFRSFSKDELKRFILESGGRYDEDLTTSTDFLVAGENSEEAVKQAIRLGTNILSEGQLIDSQLFHLPTIDGK